MNIPEYPNRRSALGRLSLGTGAVALAPCLRALANPDRPPQRFVFVMKASGLDRQDLAPLGFDSKLRSGIAWNDADKGIKFTRTKLADLAWREGALPEVLQPFAAVRNKLTVIQGLSGDNFTGNHTSGYGALSCINSEKAPLAPSLDYRLGTRFSTGPYPMFGMSLSGTLLGNSTNLENGYCYPNISAAGKAKPVPFQGSPAKAFHELFGTAVVPDDEARRRLSVRSNLMDFLRDDARRISRELGAAERERFENYTSAFESLRVREVRKAGLRAALRAGAPEFTDQYTSLLETERHACQFELATAALNTGLTNVVTLRPDTLGTIYTGLGIRGTTLHAIGHGRKVDNGWSAAKARTEVNRHQLKLIAQMARKLDAIPEGDGTMLDHTLIVYTSCAGGAHHAGQKDWPFVLVGGMGKRLKTGRYLHYPSYQQSGHRPIASLYLTIMEAAGMNPPDEFGQLDPGLRDLDVSGPLSELLS